MDITNHTAPTVTTSTQVALCIEGAQYAAEVVYATKDSVRVRTEGVWGHEVLTFRPRRDTTSLEWQWACGPYRLTVG